MSSTPYSDRLVALVSLGLLWSVVCPAQPLTPHSIAVDPSGNVYFSNRADGSIFLVDASGTLRRIAEASTAGSRLHPAQGVAVDSAGNLYFAVANQIRKLAPDGTITTVAGTGEFGFGGDGGPAQAATLALPGGLATDEAGNLFIADTGNHRIRKVTPDGMINTVAGTGIDGSSDSQLSYPAGVATDRAGNLFIADSGNNRIRRVAPDGIITTVAGAGVYGYSGDEGAAVNAQLRTPAAVALDGAGNLFVADQYNHRIRKVDPKGTIHTVASDGVGIPTGVAVDVDGNLYIADSKSPRIRKVTPANRMTDLPEAGVGLPGPVAARTVRVSPAVVPDITCIANSGIPPTLRAEGLTELSGDIVLNCSGGTPIATGVLVPSMTLTLNFNTQVTSRLLSGGGEPLLAIDEPTSAQAKACVPGTANPGAPTDPNYCPVVGTGGNANEFKSGNANILRGTIAGNALTFTGVPVDPPGNSNSRIYRITNVRVNASIIGPGNGQLPGQVLAVISVPTSSLNVAINNPTQITGFVQTSLVTAVRNAADTASLGAPLSFQQCAPLLPTRIANLSFSESFSSQFKTRTSSTTTPSGVSAQDTLNLTYNTETGYYNPNLAGGAGLSGLADFGTRLKAVFNNIPAGVTLYTATQITALGGAPGIGPGKTQANLTVSETGAYAPVAATQTLDGSPAAQLTALNGSATAVWEIVGSNSLTLESYHFPLWMSYSAANIGTGVLNAAYAPTPPAFNAASGAVAQDSSFPIPRFVDTSVGTAIFQVTACAPTTAVTVTTVPTGLSVLIDGSAFTSPVTLNWQAGSTHTIAVVSPIAAGTGMRYVFSGWNDLQAQSHTITTPASAATFVATFNAQYLLNTAASPANGGSIQLNPVSADGYYNSGTTVVLLAAPAGSYSFINWSGDLSGSISLASLIMNAPHTATANFAILTPLKLVTVNPCRLADTRNPTGPFGGPSIAGQTSRDFVVPNGACGIPSTAAAYFVNVTAVPHGSLGYITAYPTGQSIPLASTLNSLDGRVKANAAIVPAGTNGAIGIYATDTTDVILDISGYFVPAGGPSNLTFFPITPCRIADTRNSNGTLGGPFIAGGHSRSFPILAGGCGVPVTAQAYSLNFTAVPHGTLGYLTTWPTGSSMPLVSTLNAIGGQVTANAAILPAGANGSIDAFAANDTDLVIDINGYFAPSGSGGLSLYNVTPCRVIDTRNPAGSQPFSGTLTVNVGGSPCAVPGAAQAYVLNATAVPAGSLGYLSLWPQGQSQPLVSTLNALDGAVTSNMALVPTSNGFINSFAANPTYLILDINGYFAP